MGNHDRHINRSMIFWYSMGFERVYDKPILFMDDYLLSHEPVITQHHLDLNGTTLKNIHGHIHNSNSDFYALPKEDQPKWNSDDPKCRPIKDITTHSFNVSVEVINYTPIRFEQIVESMSKAPKESESIEPPNVVRDLMKRIDEQQNLQPVIIPMMPDDQRRIIPMTSDPFRDIPEACKHCSNRNPDGTLKGPCLCTLGTPPVMC